MTCGCTKGMKAGMLTGENEPQVLQGAVLGCRRFFGDVAKDRGYPGLLSFHKHLL